MLVPCLLLLLSFASEKSFSAGRPALKTPGFIDPIEKKTYVDLETLQKRSLAGWATESDATRSQYTLEATEYIQYRNMGSGAGKKSKFAEGCKIKSSVFCEIESLRAARRTALSQPRSAPMKLSRAAFLELVRSRSVTELSQMDRSQLLRGLATISDFSILEPLAEAVLAQKSHAVLALAIASKSEEYFPDPRRVELALRLYLQAGEQGEDDTTVTVGRFRASLIKIWKNDCGGVEELLSPLVDRAAAENYFSRIRFWRHHCATILKNPSLAKKMADELWTGHPMTLQNLLVNGGDKRFSSIIEGKDHPQVLYRSILNPALNSYAKAVEALLSLKNDELAAEVVDILSAQLVNSEAGFRLYLANLVNHLESGLARFKVLALLFRDQGRMITAPTLKMYFPMTHFDLIEKNKAPLDPFMIISLIRQESAFNRRAMSPVGARGLMQVMPATARQFGTRAKNKLFDPQINVRVGSRFFAGQLKKYSGDVELTLASYNAGSSRVESWLKRYPIENRALFLDMIPYRETRDYVSSILRNYYWYVHLYSKEPLKARLAKETKVSRMRIPILSLRDLASVRRR